jgi:phospholipase A2
MLNANKVSIKKGGNMKNRSLHMLLIVATFCSCLFTPYTTYSMEKIHRKIHRAHEDVIMLEDIITPNLEQKLHGKQTAITNNPHQHETASAIHNTGISTGEAAYLKNRLPVAKAALEKMLNRSLDEKQVPKIAFVTSGGGYRAMLCTTGSLCAAQQIGLLDGVTYITALSGSTWAVAPWISTGLPLQEFKGYIQKCAAHAFHETTHEEKLLIANAIAVKKTYKQHRTLVDPYGDLLANRLLACLGDLRHMTYLSDQAQKIEFGAYPYPIYTSIDGRETITTGQTWYEFTPHTIGDRTNNVHIPTWAYGRKFEKGQSTNNAPEKPLGHLMGTWGSAFAANLHTILKEVTKNETVHKDLESIEGKRILPFWAEIPNYMYKLDTNNDTTLLTKKQLKFVDSGLEINLPYPPISGICPERTVDIIVFLDASAGEIGNELKKVDVYAKTHNLPFPAINLENINTKTLSVFKDENNKATPVVIYMPRISDKKLWETHKSQPEFANHNLSEFDLDHETNHGYCSTEHFQYSLEHSNFVMHQTEFNMLVNKDAIMHEINWVIDRK